MTESKLTRLLRRFCAAAIAHHEALEIMDEERANTHASIIARLYVAILSEGADGRTGLLSLIESDSPVVAGMTAVYLMDVAPDICLDILRKIATEPGLLGFRASVVIDRWESGTWEHPGKFSES